MSNVKMNIPMPWIKTLEGDGKPVRKASIEYEDVSTYEYVKRRATNEPSNICMIFGVKGGKTLTYAQTFDSIKRLGATLIEKGVKKGDKIAVMLPNSPHYVISHYALLGIGATVVQTNPLYTERELRHIINDSGAKGIISITMFQPMITKIMDDDSTPLSWGIFGNVSDYMSPIIAFLGKLTGKLEDPKILPHPGASSFKSALVTDPSGFKEGDVDFVNDIALFQYTGGTTGLSKGAMLTFKNISYNAQQARESIHMVPDGAGAVLTALPLFHSFGLTACLGVSFQVGVPMILVPKPREQIPAGEVHKLIVKHKVAFFPAVPTMINTIINHKLARDTDWSSLIAVISGGAALPSEISKQFKDITGADLVEGYGLSETSPLLTINPILHDKVKPVVGSIGLPAPDTYLKIVDSEDKTKDMPIGEIGEIAACGPQVMMGYYNKEDENKNVLYQDGDGNTWFLTGDIGYMDDTGFTFIVDRKKDMIIVSGYNVYPREIEEVLFEHPSIFEAAVAGVTDTSKGEIVSAWVVLNEGVDLTEEDIIAYCKEKLAAYKVPKKVYFRDELPKTMIGKVLRRLLTEETSS
jgi:long-chain acyl-CoA synthetase